MYCSQCGTFNDDNNFRCIQCGSVIQQMGGPGQFPDQMHTADVPNHLAMSIVVTLLCCLPFGVVAIVYSSKVKPALAAGDYDGAVDYSQKAKTWATVSILFGLVAFIFSLVSNLT